MTLLKEYRGRRYIHGTCNFKGMLYAKTLTPPFAHAKIKHMDTSEAEEILGVRDIMRFDDPDISGDRGTGDES